MRIRHCGFLAVGSTFSQAFAAFAVGNLGNVVHDALVAAYLSHELIGHISRDSTAIVGRENPAKKAAKEPKPRRKRGRPAKGEQREATMLKRLDRQLHQSAKEGIVELPTVCDRGTKQNAKGYKTSWNGYKLHLDTNDIGLPISALVTSASLHDSQMAIPLIKLTSKKFILQEAWFNRRFRLDAMVEQLAAAAITTLPIPQRSLKLAEVQ